MKKLYAGESWGDKEEIADCDELINYPSLRFAIAREYMPNGEYATNLEFSYLLLRKAKIGYEKELMNGSDFYNTVYGDDCGLLNEAVFDNIREDLDDLFDSIPMY